MIKNNSLTEQNHEEHRKTITRVRKNLLARLSTELKHKATKKTFKIWDYRTKASKTILQAEC